MSKKSTIDDDVARTTDRRQSDYYRLRADPQRRKTIEVLKTVSGDIELSELARRVSIHSLEEMPVDQLQAQLHSRHLPMLSEAGIITYDEESKQVSLVDPVTSLLTSS